LPRALIITVECPAGDGNQRGKEQSATDRRRFGVRPNHHTSMTMRAFQ
jgi:hypothetical protein